MQSNLRVPKNSKLIYLSAVYAAAMLFFSNVNFSIGTNANGVSKVYFLPMYKLVSGSAAAHLVIYTVVCLVSFLFFIFMSKRKARLLYVPFLLTVIFTLCSALSAMSQNQNVVNNVPSIVLVAMLVLQFALFALTVYGKINEKRICFLFSVFCCAVVVFFFVFTGISKGSFSISALMYELCLFLSYGNFALSMDNNPKKEYIEAI